MQTEEPLAPFLPTLELLAARWSSAGPLLAAFPLLAQGRPVSIEEIARAADADPDVVGHAVDTARCVRAPDGGLIDLFGLTLSPTLHRLTIDGRVLFSCCALWAHVIPKLVNRTVEVESVDPMRRGLVSLTISPNGIETVDPPASAATLAVADRDAIDRDVRGAWCSRVAHFVSLESAGEFAAVRSGCHAVHLSQLSRAAERLHQVIWKVIET